MEHKAQLQQIGKLLRHIGAKKDFKAVMQSPEDSMQSFSKLKKTM